MSRIELRRNPKSRRRGERQPFCDGRSLTRLVEAFEKKWLPVIIEELDFYARQPSLEEAIRVATSKGHSHLRKIPQDVLDTARNKLLRSSRLRVKLLKFDQLYAAIEAETGDIRGVGLLTI